MLFISSIYLSACAHTPPTQGDKMLVVSDQAKELSQKWNEGNKLVSSGTAQQSNGAGKMSQGESQVTKGENLISEGEKMSSNGKQEIIRGERLQQESQNNFEEKFPANT